MGKYKFNIQLGDIVEFCKHTKSEWFTEELERVGERKKKRFVQYNFGLPIRGVVTGTTNLREGIYVNVSRFRPTAAENFVEVKVNLSRKPFYVREEDLKVVKPIGMSLLSE